VIYDKTRSKKPDKATGSTTGFHVAFLISQSATSLFLLGGNQLDQVMQKHYPLSRWEVQGYRWPNENARFAQGSYVLC